MTTPVLVVGGGLAGIAAAVRLAEAGRRVRLIEQSDSLGGRARVVAGVGPLVLGGYTHLLDLLHRLNRLGALVWLDDLALRGRSGTRAALASGRRPAPFHLHRAMSRLAAIDPSWPTAARGLWRRMLRIRPSERLAWRQRSASAWCGESLPNDAAALAVMRVLTRACFHLEPEHIDAASVLQLAHESLLPQRFGAEAGELILPVGMLIESIYNYLAAEGGDVLLNTRAEAFAYDGRRITGVVTSEGLLTGSATIAALPPWSISALASSTLRRVDRRLHGLEHFIPRPWRAVTVSLPMRVFDAARSMVADEELLWIVDAQPDQRDGQRLTLVLTPALKETNESWADRARAALGRVIPRALGLEMELIQVEDRKDAMVGWPVEANISRPYAAPSTVGVEGGAPRNFFLAGDWCATGWPAGVESAVRGGYLAAGALLGENLEVGDLPPTMIARWCGVRAAGRGAE